MAKKKQNKSSKVDQSIFKHTITTNLFVTDKLNGFGFKMRTSVQVTDEYLDSDVCGGDVIILSDGPFDNECYRGKSACVYSGEPDGPTPHGQLLSVISDLVNCKSYQLYSDTFSGSPVIGFEIMGLSFTWKIGEPSYIPFVRYTNVHPKKECSIDVFYSKVSEVLGVPLIQFEHMPLPAILFSLISLVLEAESSEGVNDETKVKIVKTLSSREVPETKVTKDYTICTFVGSREAPEHIAKVGTKFLTRYLAEGGEVWSGGSGIMDKCVEHAYFHNRIRGVKQGSVKIFLPWNTFDRKYLYKGEDKGIYIDVGDSPTQPKAREIAETEFNLYRSFERLKRGGQALMTRNSCQVLGEHCTDVSHFLVCWAKPSNDRGMWVEGGTNLAVAIAKRNNVPVLNLYHPWVEQAIRAYSDGFLDIKKLVEEHGE